MRRRVDDHDEAVTRARHRRQREWVFGRGSDCSESDEVRECLGFLWRGERGKCVRLGENGCWLWD